MQGDKELTGDQNGTACESVLVSKLKLQNRPPFSQEESMDATPRDLRATSV